MKMIPLGGKRGKDKLALIDDEDLDRVSKHKWMVSSRGYVVTTINDENRRSGKFTLSLHRFVMNAPSNMQVDHKYGSRLDNRKDELRICTNVDNAKNRKVNHTSLSGHKCVRWSKRNSKWQAYIRVGKIIKYLGFYNTADGAALAYNKAAIMYHGEFARLNVIKDLESAKLDSRSLPKVSSSGFRGVAWEPRYKTWIAKIHDNKKTIYIASFKDPLEAAYVYNQCAEQLFGDKAKLNEI